MTLVDPTRPAYRILAASGFFGPDDHLYQEGDEIYFDGEPNEEMEPLNELARIRISEFIEKLEREARNIAEKIGRPFSGRPRNLDGGLMLATELQRSGVAVMGVRKEDTSITKVTPENTPETGRRGRGRPAGAKNKAKVTVDRVQAA